MEVWYEEEYDYNCTNCSNSIITYWFTWRGSQNSNIVLTVGDFAGYVKSSTNISATNLAPVLDYKSTTAYSDIVISGTVNTNTYSGAKTTIALNITSNTFIMILNMLYIIRLVVP